MTVVSQKPLKHQKTTNRGGQGGWKLVTNTTVIHQRFCEENTVHDVVRQTGAVSSDAGITPNCYGEKGVELEGKYFDLSVILDSKLHPWQWALSSDSNNEVAKINVFSVAWLG